VSRIDDLIRQHCPHGVAYRALGDIGEVFRGRRFTKADYVQQGTGAIHYGELYTHYGTSATDVITRVRTDLAPNLRFVRPGDVVIAEVGETLEDVGKAVAWLGTEEVAIHDGCYGFRSELNPVFVAYYLQTAAFHAEKNRHVARAKVKRLSINGLRQIRVPVPPAEVQDEIVRVLDLFQSLEAELEAELEARRRQYAHYRDSLLAFSDSRERVRWVTLAEIADFTYGLTATSLEEGDLRFVRITDISEDGKVRPGDAKFVETSPDSKRYLLGRGDVLVARTGGSYGKTALIDSDEPAVFASFLIRIAVDPERVVPEYYWHFAQSGAYWTQATSLVSIGGQPQFNANALARVRVPLPPLSVQQEIVSVLDRFDALVSDISVGLPAELAARRRQYEYYRDQLLKFEEAA